MRPCVVPRDVTRIRGLLGLALVGCLAGASLAPASAYERPGHYTQVDVATNGKAANGSTPEMSMDATGRFVAFSSTASNLGASGVAQSNVYVRDLALRRTTLVSRGMNGQPAAPSAASACPSPGGGGLGSGLGSDNPAISATGRYVAFASTDVNLVRGVANATSNIYVYDLSTGTTRIASVSSSGALANGWSCNPSISADGQRVAFTSAATDLVAGDAGGLGVFVHDFRSGKTLRADVSSNGSQGTETCSTGVAGVPDVVALPTAACSEHRPASSISSDGRYVVFDSAAANLVGDDTNGQIDVFEHDLKTGATVRVSLATGGTQALTPPSAEDALAPDDIGSFLANPSCTWESHHAASADGRYVAFLSRADNLVPGDTNASPVGAGVGIDVFVRDVRSDRTYRVDVSSAGEQNGASPGTGYWTVGCDISMSADGRYLSMNSTGGFQVYDRTTGASDLFPTGLGQNAAGTAGYSGLAVVDVSASGRFVAAIMANMANHAETFDAFVWDRGDALAVDGVGHTTTVRPGQTCSGIEVGSTCVPAGGVVESSRASRSSGCATPDGGRMQTAAVVYRPAADDVFLRLSLTPGAVERARVLGTVFGIDLSVGGRSYAVRADRTGFALYGVTGRVATRLRELRGGFGTTGAEVVVAVPLHAVGLAPHGRAAAVSAFAAIGACVFDRINLG